MGQIIRKRWLTLLLLLVISGVSLWTLVGYQRLSVAIQIMQTQVAVVMPTPLPPTATSLPPTPQGPLELSLNQTDFTLFNPEGKTLFELNDAGKWVPAVSASLANQLPPDTKPFLSSEGIWVLLNEEGQVAYRWNTSTWRWLEASISPGEADTTEGMPDKYSVILPEAGIEELLLKTDEELLSLAPRLDPGNYNVAAATLVPFEVLRIGENGDIPYLLYADQDGRIRMAWNIQKGEVEHAESSTYKDPSTGFLLRAFLVTDNSVVREGKLWYALQEISEGALAKALFEYTLPLNYIYTNYQNEFSGMMSPLNRLTEAQVAAFLKEAQFTLRYDLRLLAGGEYLEIKLSPLNRLEIDRNGSVIVFRVQSGFRYASGGGSYYNVSIGAKNIAVVILYQDVSATPRRSTAVGGFLIEVIRRITTLGEDYYGRTTSQMVYQLCDNERISSYLQKKGREASQSDILPISDSEVQQLPICLFIGKR